MLKRTITGAFITVIMGAVLYFSYIPAIMTGTCIVLSVFSVYEICRASGKVNNEAYLTVSLLLAVGLSSWEMPSYLRVLKVTYIVALVGFVVLMLRQKRCSLKNPVKVLLLNLTVVLLLKSFPILRAMDSGLYYLGGSIILCAVTDVAAYLIGRSLGKHKLIPTVSPNKTVEGAVGGIVFAVLIMLILGIGMEHWQLTQINYSRLVVYSTIASVVGQFGDLCMSSVKRVCGIKDFGNIFPGHGGILDRFDSQLLVIPFTVLYLYVTDGFIL